LYKNVIELCSHRKKNASNYCILNIISNLVFSK
jgi:hypothetical protein